MKILLLVNIAITLFISAKASPGYLEVKLPADTVLCTGKSIQLKAQVTDSIGKVDYLWSTGDSLSYIQLGPLFKDTLLVVEVRDSLFQASDSIWIKIDDFTLNLSQDTITCPGNPVELTAFPVFDEGVQVSSYLWLDVSCSCPKGHTDNIMVYMPAVYSCEAINENGCSAMDTIVVVYDEEPKINFLPIPDICLNDENVTLDSFVNPKGGIWYGQDTIIIKNNVFRVNKAEAKPYLIFYSYTDTLTNCFTFDKTTMIVKDYPKINISQPFSFCDLDSLYDLSNYVIPTHGSWHSNQAIEFDSLFNPSKANPANPLFYQVDDSNGCSNVREINFRINPLPQIDFVADEFNGKMPFPVQFTNKSSIASGKLVYFLWYFGDGDSALLEHPLHTYMNAGIYDVSLHAVSDSGCWGTLSKEQMIEVFSGIEENKLNNRIKVYPNPASDLIVIESTIPEVKINQLILINSLGQECMNFYDLNHAFFKLDKLELPSGIYFIRIRDAKGNVSVKKLVIE